MEKQARIEIAKKAEKLHIDQGMSWEQIADYFHKTPQTIRNYRKELEDEEEAGGSPPGKEKNLLDEVLEGAKEFAKTQKKEPGPSQEKEIIIEKEPIKEPEKEPKNIKTILNSEKSIVIDLKFLIILSVAMGFGLWFFLRSRKKPKQIESKNNSIVEIPRPVKKKSIY